MVAQWNDFYCEDRNKPDRISHIYCNSIFQSQHINTTIQTNTLRCNHNPFSFHLKWSDKCRLINRRYLAILRLPAWPIKLLTKFTDSLGLYISWQQSIDRYFAIAACKYISTLQDCLRSLTLLQSLYYILSNTGMISVISSHALSI